MREAGGEPVVCDLENASDAEVAEAIGSVDAVVFAAGAGPGSGPDRKWTMDYGGAVKLIAAAKANGIDRYVMVSSMGPTPTRRATTRSRSTCGRRERPTPTSRRAGSTTRSCGRRS